MKILKFKMRSPMRWIDAPVVKWLAVDYQERENCFVLWAMVDESLPIRTFQIIWVETGKLVSNTLFDGFEYLGTAQWDGYVAHFFVGDFTPQKEKEDIEKKKEIEIEKMKVEIKKMKEVLQQEQEKEKEKEK